MSEANKIISDAGKAITEVRKAKRRISGSANRLKVVAAGSALDAIEQGESLFSRLYGLFMADKEEVLDAVKNRVAEKPISSLLIALGVGYVGSHLIGAARRR